MRRSHNRIIKIIKLQYILTESRRRKPYRRTEQSMPDFPARPASLMLADWGKTQQAILKFRTAQKHRDLYLTTTIKKVMSISILY
jgi:hypothetical protein